MRPFERLADNEFEDLVGDLLGAEEDRRYERFRRGPDQGIDLRYMAEDVLSVVQCKHYRNSTISQLRAAARSEAVALEKSGVEPTRYRFVTSLPLTPPNKAALADDLGEWVAADSDVIGGNDLEALLDLHPEVERRHVKLWLSGGTALAALLKADVLARSRALLASIDRALPLYVQTEAFLLAHEKLTAERVCLISGQPGIGKSTLARMLVADAVKQGFEPVEVSNDIEEAWGLNDPQIPQVFYYDDFLGTTTLGELQKNEDQRLIAFIREVMDRPNAYFILTTREYILNQAIDLYESFERAGIGRNRFLLEIGLYGQLDRAKILYNHLYHSDLPVEARRSLARDRRYNRIISHPLFNPRLIEAVTTGYGQDEVEEGLDFVDYAVSVLEDPGFFWRRIYDRQLGDSERLLLLALVSMPRPVELVDLQQAFVSLAAHRGLASDDFAFRAALRVLHDSLVRSWAVGPVIVVAFVNPSVEDFLEERVRGDRALLDAAAESAVFFDQLAWIVSHYERLDDERRASLAERCFATFDSPSVVWNRFKSEYGQLTLHRAERDLESRLLFVLSLLGPGKEFEELRRSADERFQELAAGWQQGDGCAAGARSLVAALEAEDLNVDPPADLLRRLKTLLVIQAASAEDYRDLLDFIEEAPQVFSDEDIDSIADQFLFEATEALNNPQEFKSIVEINKLEDIADMLDLQLDPHLLGQARQNLTGRRKARADMDFESHRKATAKTSMSRVAEGVEIDNLFSHLLD
ncbi:MAG TPA: restriction endonuclease [Solirubrobacterales bacterium]|nr:restriction endonuclease [Solirubrobacterales bacterium]